MRFVKIPDMKNAWDNVVITALSPSMFSWINTGCTYQVLLQKALDSFNNKSFLLPPYRATIVGTIVHKIYELASKKTVRTIVDLSNTWEDLINKKEEELRNNYPTLQNVDINDYDKRNKCFRYALAIIKGVSQAEDNSNRKETHSEYWLDCSDIGLRGIIDRIYISTEGIDIVDYKSGSVVDESGNVKEEYIAQLNLYAFMCEHRLLGKIKSLTLIDIDGNKFSVEYDRESKSKYLSKVRQTIDFLNTTIKERAFDRVAHCNDNICSKCSVRHICEKKSIPQDTISMTITGRVSEIISANLYKVITSNGEEVYISGLSIYEIDNHEDYINRKLSFVNILSSNLEQPLNCFKVTNNTIIYEL